MANALQNVYSNLIDEKLRASLVTREHYVFNPRHEGNPTGGKVLIPVRGTEVEVVAYDPATGAALAEGTSTYQELTMAYDEAVNEIIDGYEAMAVPDDVAAERLDSAAYALAKSMDAKSIALLESVAGNEICETVTQSTAETAFANVLDARSYLSRCGVPLRDRWLIVSPEFHALLMQDASFIREGELAQSLTMAGAVGQVAGFAVYESNHVMREKTGVVEGKAVTTEFIAGHPNWCHRVTAWSVPAQIRDLTNNFIGSSAVQGRKVYGMAVSKPETVYVKRIEA